MRYKDQAMADKHIPQEASNTKWAIKWMESRDQELFAILSANSLSKNMGHSGYMRFPWKNFRSVQQPLVSQMYTYVLLTKIPGQLLILHLGQAGRRIWICFDYDPL